ncbi:MAG TPA: hypothetical protein VIJ63_09070 [Roseiarcus sp.]
MRRSLRADHEPEPDPHDGSTFVVESFVTVVIGGADVLMGTAPAGVLLAIIWTALNAWHGRIVGQIGLLIAVILVIRVLPDGIVAAIPEGGVNADAFRRHLML